VTTYLLDANVLIALSVLEHEHHDRASDWLANVPAFALCPVVEGALVRFALRMSESTATSAALLDRVRAHPRCRFWPDDISYRDLDMADLQGHRQVTDAYLADLAAAHGGRLATFDQALIALRPAVALAIP
jgi:toxin-antitoxin system PIN domain toxin